jgi:hypothetical protein
VPKLRFFSSWAGAFLLPIIIWGVSLPDLDAGTTAPPPEGAVFPDHPLPAHTGGFREPTCHACHFDNHLNDPAGKLVVEGWPRRARADSTYRITVRLDHPELVYGGFQLAIRTQDGRQGGTLTPIDGRSATTVSREITYLHQTGAGTDRTREKEMAWTFRWTPSGGAGMRFLHISANASDGDNSAFGDFIYTDSLAVRVIR